MKVEKVINNNVISTFDDSGMEVVVMGRGIAYKKKPGDFVDKTKVEKIFRIENEEALSRFEALLSKLPLEHIQVSNDIISYAKKELNINLNQNIYITLTDHINFAIQRLHDGDIFHNALINEVRMFYPKEFQVGLYALDLIKTKTKIELPEDEAASIALHIINAELNMKIRDVWGLTTFIQKIVNIIEQEFHVEVIPNMKKDYLIANLKLLGKKLLIDGNHAENSDSLVEFVKREYDKEFICVEKIAEFINKEYNCIVSEEDKAYLTLDLKRIMRDTR